MDCKITASRLKTFFVYDFYKYVAIIVGAILLFTIIFNLVEDQPSEGQEFSVLYSSEITVEPEGNIAFANALESGVSNRGFSYEILRFKYQQITIGDKSLEYMLRTYTELADDDIYISSPLELEYYISNFNAENLNEYVDNAIKYCQDNGFYVDGEINEENIRQKFSEKHKKDKRFKKKEKFNEGVSLEISRVKAIWENAHELKSVFTAHPEILQCPVKSFEWAGETITGNFAINLSKLTGGESLISNAFSRTETTSGGETTVTTDGIYLLVGRNEVENQELHYEALAYILQTIKRYSNFIK